MMQENGSLIVWHGQDKPLSGEFVRHLKRGGVADDEIVRWHADDTADLNRPDVFQTAFTCRPKVSSTGDRCCLHLPTLWTS